MLSLTHTKRLTGRVWRPRAVSAGVVTDPLRFVHLRFRLGRYAHTFAFGQTWWKA